MNINRALHHAGFSGLHTLIHPLGIDEPGVDPHVCILLRDAGPNVEREISLFLHGLSRASKIPFRFWIHARDRITTDRTLWDSAGSPGEDKKTISIEDLSLIDDFILDNDL